MAKRGSVRIEILPTAKIDLKEIVDFIAQGSNRYAVLEKQLIINAINQLLDFPNLGKPFDYKSIDARQLVFKNYLIIYRYKTETVLEILTIHHHARSITNNPAFTDED
ncbi:type II toxin-antitoxin system RelE/ParE family toxin [Mucilaginibacter sp.]|uniref:type II toxin-antitoxin system RelE/ParE family toxin n=1 Tax=Mucilaginibacter sp. TaxID=1882438 RepID=UPI0026304B7F|nr:type II toxin-antitoxin system RelE/ParE family toxin [Mucilaginibacter sp.]MDB5032151.1 type toxin-antitoxin system RelE/ParE family toxin [Mucilaginibacter sp.]